MDMPISSFKPVSLSQVPVLLAFGSRRVAEKRVAGVSALARVLREFQTAGIDQVRVLFEDGDDVSEECRRDIARIAPEVRFELADRSVLPRPAYRDDGGETFTVCGRYLIPGEIIRAFISGLDRDLVWHGKVIASRRALGDVPLNGEPTAGPDQPDNVRHDQIIALDHPGRAGWALLLRTGKSSDGPVASWLNRPISRRISALALHLPWLRPHHVTVLTAVIAAAMFACFLFGGETALLVGGILFHVASVVDGVDGEIARVSFRSTVSGAVFDMIVDRLTILAFFLGITIALARLYGDQHAIVGGWGFAAAAIGVLVLSRVLLRLEPPRSYSIIITTIRRRFRGEVSQTAIDILSTLIGRDVFSFVFPVLIVCGLPWMVTWLFSGFTTFWLIVVLSTIPALLRSAPRADRASGPVPAEHEAQERA